MGESVGVGSVGSGRDGGSGMEQGGGGHASQGVGRDAGLVLG